MDIGEELPQFALPLDAPDGQHVLILAQPGIGGGGVVDEPAGEPLHGDEAHARLPAGPPHPEGDLPPVGHQYLLEVVF